MAWPTRLRTKYTWHMQLTCNFSVVIFKAAKNKVSEMLFVLSMTTAEQKERHRAFEERIRFWRDIIFVCLEMPYGTRGTCLFHTLCIHWV